MRAYQFIFEYRRDKTAEALADKLIFALQNTKSAFLQDSLLGPHTLNDNARKLLRTIEEVKDISPKALKAYIREYNEPEVDGASYQVLEMIYPKIIYYERNSNYDKDFSVAVKNDLFIRSHMGIVKTVIRNMQEIGKVGDWTIGFRT